MAVTEQQVVTTTTTEEEEGSSTTNGYFSPSPTNYSYEYRNIGSSIGFAVGLIYAFKVKSGFWKGWGYTILGSIALGGLGYGIGMSKKKK